MEPVLSQACKRVRKASSRKHRKLRESCEFTLASLQKTKYLSFGPERYWELFDLALGAQSTEVLEAALEGIYHLLVGGHVKTGGSVERQGRVVELCAILSDEICGALESISKVAGPAADAARLWGAKAILACIESTEVKVHGQQLVRSLRALHMAAFVSRLPAAADSARMSMQQLVLLTFSRMESLGGGKVCSGSYEEEGEASPDSSCIYPCVIAALAFETVHEATDTFSPLYIDALLILRELCRNSEGEPTDAAVMRMGTLLHALEKWGPAFRTDKGIMDCIGSDLCAGLRQHCTSHSTPLVSQALRLFVVLSKNFRQQLKAEIEAFVSSIFLRILSSSNRCEEQKMLVLEVLCELCSEPQHLVEIFLNYDCDLEGIDLFKSIVTSMAYVAKQASMDGAQSHPPSFPHLSEEAVRGLLIILTSLQNAAGHCDEDIHSGEGQLHHQSARALGHRQAWSEGQLPPELLPEKEAHDDLSNDVALPPASHLTARKSYNLKARRQEELETGFIRFNMKPDAGLAWLGTRGHLQHDNPHSVAEFLRLYCDRLDKTVIGEYLGREPQRNAGFNVAVLHAYVDGLDFSGMLFDEAIRKYLSGFRLPGEAQKIDRMMEKFAERYCLQNQGVFPSPDTAFILAFSIIMLNTDLHNPAIKEERKMNKPGFISNNRGISSGKDLDDHFLGCIFDRIKEAPISLREDDLVRVGRRQPSALFSSTWRRPSLGVDASAFQRETDDMLKASAALLSHNKKHPKKTFYVTMHTDTADDEKLAAPTVSIVSLSTQVAPMFEIVWGPSMSVFSQVIESSNENLSLVPCCLTGFRLAIQLAGQLNNATARDALINSLARFTGVDMSVQQLPRMPLATKNVLCVQLLLSLALTDGNVLGRSWSVVLQCISQLSRLQLLAEGLADDGVFFSPSSAPASAGGLSPGEWEWVADLRRTLASVDLVTATGSAGMGTSSRSEPSSDALRAVMDQLDIDGIFMGSAVLSMASLRQLVQQLVAVSREEVLLGRVYSLQKLVEVADANMDTRGRIEWRDTWGDIGAHLSNVGSSRNNPRIAVYAVDCLRQLALKFLTKPELRDFSFQRAFLGPFESVMRISGEPVIREFVVQCLAQVVAARGSSIRSGWATIFAVLKLAAKDEEEQVVQLSCSLLDKLVGEQLCLVSQEFSHLIDCLLTMTGVPHLDVALSCIGHLRTCARALAAGDVDPARGRSLKLNLDATCQDTSSHKFDTAENPLLHLWWMLLYHLAKRVGDTRLDVRSAAISTIRDTLREYPSEIFGECGVWSPLFQSVLFTMMTHTSTDGTVTPRLSSSFPGLGTDFPLHMDSWIATTVPQIFQTVVEVYLKNMGWSECSLCLPLLLDFFGWYVAQEVEVMSRLAIQALGQLVEGLGGKHIAVAHTPHIWSTLCVGISKIIHRCLPLSLLSGQPPTPDELGVSAQQPKLTEAMTHLVASLRLQQLAFDILRLHLARLGLEDASVLLKALHASIRYARRFNTSLGARAWLYSEGFMLPPDDEASQMGECRLLPHLLDQEAQGLCYYFASLYLMLGVPLHLDDYVVSDLHRAEGGLRNLWLATPAGRHPKLIMDAVSSVASQPILRRSSEEGSWDWAAVARPLIQEEAEALLAHYCRLDASVQQRLSCLDSESDLLASEVRAEEEAGRAAGHSVEMVDWLRVHVLSLDRLTDAVLQILGHSEQLTRAEFEAQAPWLYGHLCLLVTCRNLPVRRALKKIFLGRMSSLIPSLGGAASEKH